jgi:hypothetical protein
MTYKPKSVTEALIMHLVVNRGEWIEGYLLEKVWLFGKFTGTAALRRLREAAEQGYGYVNGKKYYVERRIKGKYVCYRCTGAEQVVQKVEQLPDRSVRIKNETVKLF